jgi:hypothetical protein
MDERDQAELGVHIRGSSSHIIIANRTGLRILNCEIRLKGNYFFHPHGNLEKMNAKFYKKKYIFYLHSLSYNS